MARKDRTGNRKNEIKADEDVWKNKTIRDVSMYDGT